LIYSGLKCLLFIDSRQVWNNISIIVPRWNKISILEKPQRAKRSTGGRGGASLLNSDSSRAIAMRLEG
jgi:hypothetical protein